MLTLVLPNCWEKKITERGELFRDSLALISPRKLEFVSRNIQAGVSFSIGDKTIILRPVGPKPHET